MLQRTVLRVTIGGVVMLAGCVHQSVAQHLLSSASQAAGARGTGSAIQVQLNAQQAQSIKVGVLGVSQFVDSEQAVGTISYASNLTVDVYPPYQGKLLQSFVVLGEKVSLGQPLYTIDSPDLVQAEATLINATATLEQAKKELVREEALTGSDGVSQRQLEQTLANEQTAEGAFKAARQAVLIFGKTETEVDTIAATRRVDPALVVRSSLSGVVTAFDAPAGMLVQPGTPPAPVSVARVTTKWMLASVSESDLAFYRLGEIVTASVPAYPGRVFRGSVQTMSEMLDPSTHRMTVRSAIADPGDVLRPGMLASFNVRRRNTTTAMSIPAEGVVREPDGTMTAWVTQDNRHFTQRVIQVGSRQDDRVEVLSGLKLGEQVVTFNSVFLSSMLQPSGDN